MSDILAQHLNMLIFCLLLLFAIDLHRRDLQKILTIEFDKRYIKKEES